MGGTGPAEEARIANARRLNDDVVDRELTRKWLASGFLWLLLFPTVGVILSTKFTYPEFLGSHPWLTFGRIRPIHVNGVIWGAFSTLFIGLCHYIVPRLCGVRLWNERWSHWLIWIWNVNLAVAVLLLAGGWNRGWEAGEFALVNVIVIFLALLFLTAQFLITIKNRREAPLYVSLWYLIAAFVWTDVNLILLMLGRWQEFGRNLPAKFLIVGSIMYLVGCFQGSLEALRALQQPTHFTDFVISHSHLTVFGTFVVWAIAGAIYVWPRITDSELASFTLANWGF